MFSVKCFKKIKSGLCTRESKLQIVWDNIIDLGHEISSECIKQVEDRVETIKNQPPPNNVTDLYSSIEETINYLFKIYFQFLRNVFSFTQTVTKKYMLE